MARSAARRAWYVFVLATLMSSTAYAQSIITGTVRDVSGAAMPGVTVEASSPALIERTRSTVTDASGTVRCATAAELYRGELLPEDRYAPWSEEPRARLRSRPSPRGR